MFAEILSFKPPIKHREKRRLATEFSSQNLISVILVKIWNGSNQLQSLQSLHTRSSWPDPAQWSSTATGQDCSSGENNSALINKFTGQPILKDSL